MIRLLFFTSLRETPGVAEWESAETRRQPHVAVNQVINSPAAAVRDCDAIA